MPHWLIKYCFSLNSHPNPFVNCIHHLCVYQYGYMCVCQRSENVLGSLLQCTDRNHMTWWCILMGIFIYSFCASMHTRSRNIVSIISSIYSPIMCFFAVSPCYPSGNDVCSLFCIVWILEASAQACQVPFGRDRLSPPRIVMKGQGRGSIYCAPLTITAHPVAWCHWSLSNHVLFSISRCLCRFRDPEDSLLAPKIYTKERSSVWKRQFLVEWYQWCLLTCEWEDGKYFSCTRKTKWLVLFLNTWEDKWPTNEWNRRFSIPW